MGSELRRELGLLLLVGIGIGGMIGSGVFTLQGLISSVAGPAALLAIIIIGIITLILGLMYAELGSMYPRAGGPYYFPKEVLGDLNGFVTGWSYYLCCFIGTAAIIYTFILYLSFYIPNLVVGLTLTPLGTLIALLLLAIVTYINVIGVRYGAGLNFILTVLRIIPLLLFIGIALYLLKPANFKPFAPFGASGIALAIAFGFWMYVGFESIVIVGEEVKEPAKNIVRGMILTVIIVTIIYILTSFSFIGIIDWRSLGLAEGAWESLANLSSPLADVTKAIGLNTIANVITIGVCISTLGCFSDWVLLQGRIAFAMARDRRFWYRLGEISPRYGTPSKALIFSSILTAVVMILIPAFPSVILLAMITEFIPYAVGCLSLIIARRTMPQIQRSFRVPFASILMWLGFTLSSLYIYWACWPWTLTGCLLALIGFIIYRFLPYRKPEYGRNLWYIAYLIGLPTISLLGDQTFVYNNFLPIAPLNILKMPFDILTITVFASIIYVWAYISHTRSRTIS